MDNWGLFIMLFASALCILPFFEKINDVLSKFRDGHPKIALVSCFFLFFVATMKVGTASFSPFIYFQF
jgi:hypothetical protein